MQASIKTREEAVAFSQNPNNRTILAIPVLLIAAIIFGLLGALFSYLEKTTTKHSNVVSGVHESAVVDEFSKI